MCCDNRETAVFVHQLLSIILLFMFLFMFASQEPPFVDFTTEEERHYNPNKLWKGMCIDLLEILKGSLGFEYEIYQVPDGSYGSQTAGTGEWNGLMGELVKGVGLHFM